MRYTYKIFFAIWVFSMGSLLFSQNYQEVQKLQDEYKKVLERQALQKPLDVVVPEAKYHMSKKWLTFLGY